MTQHAVGWTGTWGAGRRRRSSLLVRCCVLRGVVAALGLRLWGTLGGGDCVWGVRWRVRYREDAREARQRWERADHGVTRGCCPLGGAAR